MKTKFSGLRFPISKATAITALDCQAVAYLKHAAPPETRKECWLVQGYSGRRSKPDFYFSYSTEEKARAKVAEHFANVRARESYRTDRRQKRNSERCTTPEAIYAKLLAVGGRGGISAAETAICVRAALGKKFPGVKFSVTSDNYSMGCSCSVRWVDGPKYRDVKSICDQYSFSGFDGMIDLKYSIDRWMSPDGTMSLAQSEGTSDSNGVCSEAIGDPHAAQVVLVTHGADSVHCTREMSFGATLSHCRTVCQKWGVEMPEAATFADHNALWRWINSQRVSNAAEYLSTLIHRESEEVA